MRNTILGIIALGVLGACNSEPKEEVGRYVPLGDNTNLGILDTKTGLIYYTTQYSSNTYFIQLNPIKPQVKGAKVPFGRENLQGKGENYE